MPGHIQDAHGPVSLGAKAVSNSEVCSVCQPDYDVWIGWQDSGNPRLRAAGARLRAVTVTFCRANHRRRSRPTDNAAGRRA
jgi:hypothetical protein